MRYLNLAALVAPFVLLALLLASIIYTPATASADPAPRAALIAVPTVPPVTGDLIEFTLDPAPVTTGAEGRPVEPLAASSGLRMPYFSFERALNAPRGL